ncbi:30S ribosomal protein S3, partial [Lactobacillus sp. XV13L]|nr:30S ribosomal protein S3 [Lactobacillus sp. XV13L]
MGQKINPIGFRLGIVRDWDSKWYANKKDFSKFLLEDIKIRRFIEKKLANASVSRIEIERDAKKINVSIHT